MLKIAVIGTGNIAPAHINSYLKFHEHCEIVALCDIAPGKARKMKEQFKLNNVEIYDSHEKMLQHHYDLVSICTPPFVHAGIAIDFLNAGCNVLVEKPLAASLEECDMMIAAEKRSGKRLGVVAQNRFTDNYIKLKAVIDSGLAGKILFSRINSLWWRGHCYYDLWWRGAWKTEGGGCTLNHAVHHIDLLGWFMGRPENVSAVLSNIAHDNAEIEDVSVGVMRYSNGAMALVTSSLIHHGEEQSVEFQCDRGMIAAPWKVFASDSRANGFPERNTALEQELTAVRDNIPTLEHTGHEAQILNMLDAVIRNSTPLVGSRDGRLAIELITAIYKAGFSGHTVTLPLNRNDSFYTLEGIRKNVRNFHEKTVSLDHLEEADITVSGN